MTGVAAALSKIKGIPSAGEYSDAFRFWLNDNIDILSDYCPAGWTSVAEYFNRLRPFHRLLRDEGWARWGWPTEFGGAGGHPSLRGAMYDAIYDAGFDVPRGFELLEVVGPTLIQFAPEIAQTYLPQLLSGDVIVSQGFSEPDAGSDLASLRTRAESDGDTWRVNGQKLWVSHAHAADWCLLLTRTGTLESRHRGLTMFWMDMRSSGVTARPIEFADGRDELAEVFLDDVVVRDSNRVGEVGGGWEVAMYLLQYERGNYAWQRQAWLRSLMTHALRSAGAEVDPAAIGAAYLDLVALRASAKQTLHLLADGQFLGPLTSIDKLLLAETEQSVLNIARAMTWPATELGTQLGVELESDWFYSRAATIYGGAVEVQRDVVAQQLLNLPRSWS